MSQFSPGHVVICIDPSDDLVLQESYLVLEVRASRLRLEPVRPGRPQTSPLLTHAPDRFKLGRWSASGPLGADAYRLRSAFLDELPAAARDVRFLMRSGDSPEVTTAFELLRAAMESVAVGLLRPHEAEASVVPLARALARKLV